MRVVLDSNVLLAAFGTRGLCEAVMEVCLAEHEVVLSEPILVEVARNLRAKFKMSEARAGEHIAFLRDQAELVEPVAVARGACRDRDDLVVLGTAVAAGAGCLVTGDHDLLELGQFRGTKILSPRAFYDQLR